MTKQDIPNLNGYEFWRDKGNELAYNLFAIKDNDKYHVPIIYSEGEDGFNSQLERLKGYIINAKPRTKSRRLLNT